MKANNLLPWSRLSPQIFRLACKVLCDHRIGRVKNRLCAAIVLLKYNNAYFVKGILKLPDVAKIGTTKSINGLISIANDTDIVMTRRKLKHDFVLRDIRILIFVYQNIFKSLLERSQHIWVQTK